MVYTWRSEGNLGNWSSLSILLQPQSLLLFPCYAAYTSLACQRASGRLASLLPSCQWSSQTTRLTFVFGFYMSCRCLNSEYQACVAFISTEPFVSSLPVQFLTSCTYLEIHLLSLNLLSLKRGYGKLKEIK